MQPVKCALGEERWKSIKTCCVREGNRKDLGVVGCAGDFELALNPLDAATDCWLVNLDFLIVCKNKLRLDTEIHILD